jgi:uncharacterized protein with beta-barrel porin domain
MGFHQLHTTRTLLSLAISSVIATSAYAADVVIDSALTGFQDFQSDTTSILVTSTGSIDATNGSEFDDGISLEDGGHNLTSIIVQQGGSISAGWDAIYTGDEGANTIGFIQIDGDLFSDGVANGSGVAMDFDTTVTGDVIIGPTGSFGTNTSNGNVCEIPGANCAVTQGGITSIATVGGDLINQGFVLARAFGVGAIGYVEKSTGEVFAGSVGGDVINSGTTFSAGAGLAVIGGSSVGGDVRNTADGNINVLSETGAGILVSSLTVNYDDTLVNPQDPFGDGTADGFVLGSVQTVVSGSVVNSGLIMSGSDGLVVAGNVLVGGDIVNAGQLMVDENGIEVLGSVADSDGVVRSVTVEGNVINSGSIAGGSDQDGEFNAEVGVYVTGGSTVAGDVRNSGDITATTGMRISNLTREVDDSGDEINQSVGSKQTVVSGDFVNSGDINVQIFGMAIEFGALVEGNVINDGTITALSPEGGGAWGIILDSAFRGVPTDSSTVTGNIINNGTVTGDSTLHVQGNSDFNLEAAVYLNGVFNEFINTGTIENLAFANDGVSTAIRSFRSTDVVTNSGDVTGLIRMSGGTFNSLGGNSNEIIGAGAINIRQNAADSVATVTTVNGDLSFSGPLGIDAIGMTSGDSSIVGSRLSVTGDADLTGAEVSITVTNDDVVNVGDEFVFVDAGSLTTDITSAEDDSALLGFTVEQRDNTLVAVAEQGDATAILAGLEGGNTGNNQAVGAAINELFAVQDDIEEGSELDILIGELGALGEDEVVAATESLQPESGNGNTVGATSADNAAASTVSQRQTALRGSMMSGMAAGDDAAISGFWVQLYDSDTDQSSIDDVDGFDADTYGVALGIDAPIDDNIDIGVAFSFADTDVDSKGVEGNEMTIESYRLAFYGSYHDENYFMDGQISYAQNQYDGQRNLFNGLVATTDHDGDQYGVRLRGGYPIAFDNGVYLIPKVTLEYAYLSEDEYSEKGSVGNAGLNVDTDSVSALLLGLGGEISYALNSENYTFIPEFHMMIQHDFIGDEVEIDSNFQGATSAAFITEGANAELTGINSGVGLRVVSDNSLSFALRYDYLYKKDYNSQSYNATVRYTF